MGPQAENGESDQAKGNKHRRVLRIAASEPGMETIECPTSEAQTALKASPPSILEHLGVQGCLETDMVLLLCFFVTQCVPLVLAELTRENSGRSAGLYLTLV